jgi:hypothetical protein
MDDLKRVTLETNALVRSGIPLVHELVDMRGMTRFPTQINEFAWIQPYLKEANLGWLIIISHNPLVRFIANTLCQVARARMRSFETFEGAVEFLKFIDSTLTHLPAQAETTAGD